MMNIKKKKEQLMKQEISVYDLTPEEVEKITKSVKKELTTTKEELVDLNKKIKAMKAKIDNWA
ncbi:MAG: hypothetical protein IJ629_01240 [Clostridia bacterium]|nr:hypothetical protein [Clostridia bacterium]